MLGHEESIWRSFQIPATMAAIPPASKGIVGLGQPCHTECDVVGQQMKPWKDAAAEPGPERWPNQPGGGPAVLIPIREDTFSVLAQKQQPTYGWRHHQDNTELMGHQSRVTCRAAGFPFLTQTNFTGVEHGAGP